MIRVANGRDDIFLHTRVDNKDKDNMEEIDDKAQQPTANLVNRKITKISFSNLSVAFTTEKFLPAGYWEVGNYKEWRILKQDTHEYLSHSFNA